MFFFLWFGIRFCTVTSRQVFLMKLCMHCRGELCHFFFWGRFVVVFFLENLEVKMVRKLFKMAPQRFQNGAVGTPRSLWGGSWRGYLAWRSILAWIWAPFGTPFGTFWRLWSALEGLLRRPERLWRPFWRVFFTSRAAPNAEAQFVSEICNHFLYIFHIFSDFLGMKFRSSHLLSHKLQSTKSLHIFKLTCTARGFLA